MKFIQTIPPFVIVIAATILEVSGDAIIRNSIYNYTGVAKFCLMLAGAILVFGYGFTINLTAIEFREIAGLYIACLFITWQVINAVAFHTYPNLPIAIGGAFIITGGLIVTFWKP